MTLQIRFRKFHELIQLARFEENAVLRDKRDRVLERLRTNCSQTFTTFNQGSYEMGTGIVPVKGGDFDIDVGVVFGVEPGSISPKTVKGWVHAAVLGHTKDVRWKNPCITVQYQDAGQPIYHVDLAVYAKDRLNQLHLARGKEHSSAPESAWERSEAQELTRTIGSQFSGEDQLQFRRTVRYLKRWKDVHFPKHGHAAPRGIGLTILAHRLFMPVSSGYPASHDDLGALRQLVSRISSSFSSSWKGSGLVYRIEAKCPVAPHDDVFSRMTDQQASEFRSRLNDLNECLDQASLIPSGAALRKAFGSDFPD